MYKSAELRNAKVAAKAADRHQIVSPRGREGNAPLWARSTTTQRVADLFRTERGLPGHWQQLQQEVSRGNTHFQDPGVDIAQGRELARFIAAGIEKAAGAANFDFGELTLKFPNDWGWLKIRREDGKVIVRSRP
jgi:hypothetical protein